MLIKAIKILNDKNINVTLTIVGGSVKRTDTEKGNYLRNLKKMVRSLNLTNKIIFAGTKYDTELRKYYQTSDIFVYTSKWENFGQVILEASAAGLPLICTPVGVALDLITPGETGYFVKINDPNSIAENILKLKNSKVRQKIRKKLISIVKQNYSEKIVSEKYLDIYKKYLPQKMPDKNNYINEIIKHNKFKRD